MKVSEQQFRELIHRYLKGTGSPEERELLDRFFDSYQSERIDEDVVNNARLREELLAEIHTRTSHLSAYKNSRIRRWLSLAAVISLFVVAYFFTDQPQPVKDEPFGGVVRVQTGMGERRAVQLPDGTSAYLNARTEISYPSTFDGEAREVTVRGEAYFEVVKNGKPFIVHAGGVRTEVLGTSFNVWNRDSTHVEVTLVEGKVQIISSSGESSVLRANQKANVELNTGSIHTGDVNVLAFTSWKDNVLYFEETTLRQAVSTLEDWYGVKIDILNPAIEQCIMTAKYRDEPLGNVLGSFQFLLDLKVMRLNPRHYTIDGKGCR